MMMTTMLMMLVQMMMAMIMIMMAMILIILIMILIIIIINTENGRKKKDLWSGHILGSVLIHGFIYHWTKKRIYLYSKFRANHLQMPHLLNFAQFCHMT